MRLYGVRRHFQAQNECKRMRQELAKDVLRQRVLREDDARRSRLQEIERTAGSVAILRRFAFISAYFSRCFECFGRKTGRRSLRTPHFELESVGLLASQEASAPG